MSDTVYACTGCGSVMGEEYGEADFKGEATCPWCDGTIEKREVETPETTDKVWMNPAEQELRERKGDEWPHS